MDDKTEIDPITYCSPEETETVAGGTPAMPPPPPPPPPPWKPGGEDLRPW